MRTALILFLTLLGALPAWGAPGDEAIAINFFNQGLYAQGREVLDQALARPFLPPASRAEVLRALGQFHLTLSANPLEAERTARRILELGSGNEADAWARKTLDRLGEERERHAEGDWILAALSASPSGAPAGETVGRMRDYLAANPDYWRAAEAWHALALAARNQGRYARAFLDLERAAALAPAVDFFLPVATLAAQVRELRNRQWASRTAHGFLAFSAALALGLFLAARPWRWFGLGHLAGGAVLSGAWFAVYAACFAAFSRGFDPRGILAADPNMTHDFLLNTALAGPGAGPALALAGWGLLGVVILCLFALGASRLAGSWTALAACWLFAWLLFGSLAGEFAVRNLWGAAYEAPAGSVFRHVRGFFFFDVA
ncbi:MAG: tetratricopeptide repeat protein, partial [Pseudomonadota bacterium]